MKIPKSVTQDELMAAMQPVYDLLGVTSLEVYDTPGIHIGEGRIFFTVAMGQGERPDGVPVKDHPQGLLEQELVVPVSVCVVRW